MHNINTNQESNSQEEIFFERNIYDDNTTDINTLADLPKSASFDILSKNNEGIMFEMGDDFWKYENGNLYQYPDFVSLRDNLSPKVVFSTSIPSENKDYGVSIVNSLKNFDFTKIQDFDFKDRSDYIKTNAPKVNINDLIDKKGGIKRKQVLDTAISDSLKSIESKELKPAIDLVKSTLSVLSLFLIFSKKNRIQIEKQELINKIIKALENKEIKISDILDDQALQAQIPELKELVKKYQERSLSSNLVTDIEELLNDKSVIDTAENLSENPAYKIKLGEELYNNIHSKLSEHYEDVNFSITQAFENSGLSLDEFTMGEIKNNFYVFQQNNPNMSAEEFNLAGAFLNASIKPNEKELLAEFANSDDLSLQSLKNITSVITEVVSKFITQTQQIKI